MKKITKKPAQKQKRQPGKEFKMNPKPKAKDDKTVSSGKLAGTGSKHLLDYSFKGAIVSFTRSLSSQLLERKIRVNGVAPGPVWTPLIPASFPKKKVKGFGSKSPMGRPAEPEEIAPSYVFLASDDASFYAGQILHPNGGEIING